MVDAVDHLADERLGQHGPRHALGHAALAGIEDRRLVEGADGVAVRALHIVGEDQQFRLGVDLGLVRQDQRVVAHARLRTVGALFDDDAALEYAPRLVAHDALGQLGRRPVPAAVGDDGRQVGMALVAQEIDAVEADGGALPWMRDLGLDPLAPRAGGQEGLAEGCARREPDRGGRDRHALRAVGRKDDAFQPAALGNLDVERDRRHRAVRKRFVAFEQRQRRAGSYSDQHGGGDRGGIGGDKAQLGDRVQPRLSLDMGEALDEAVGHEKQLAAERRERPGRGHLGLAGDRRQHAQ